MSLPLGLSALSPPVSIREVAKNVVARPYFQDDLGRDQEGMPLFLQVIRWTLKPFEWLFDSLSGLPDALRWLIVVVCVLLCVAILLHIFYILLSAIRGPLTRHARRANATIKELDPSELEAEADRIQAREDYIGAIRLLFGAALRRLEIFEKKKFRPGITNRELLAKYRSSPYAESLLQFVQTIDVKWYGRMPCEQADYVSCRNEHGRICQYIRQSKSADGS